MLDTKNKLIIAHRGAHWLEGKKNRQQSNENTLPAFLKAVEINADGIELDVRQSLDKVLVVHHDPSIGKYKIKDLSYHELKYLKPQLITLEELLINLQWKIKLDVEIKETGYERECVEMLLKYFLPKDFVITSFRQNVVKKIKQDFPEIKVGLLLTDLLCAIKEFINFFDWQILKDSLFMPKSIINIPDFFCCHWRQLLSKKSINPKFLNKILYVYTVNEPGLIKKLLLHPWVAGIITDKPELALKLKRIMQ